MLNRKELRDSIYSKINELPTLPAVVPKLMELTESRESSARDVTRVIENDPALTAKILRVANSAYYGFSGRIEVLGMAVPLLGFNMVRSLAISISVMQSLPEGKGSRYFTEAGLWLHSLGVAAVMKELGTGVKKGEDTEYLFIIGLLHDIGKIVLDQYFHDTFQDVLEEANSGNNARLYLVEREKFGIDHCEISAMLLERWKFPEKIVSVIASMHKESQKKDSVDTALLRVSNVLSQELNLGSEGNMYPGIVNGKDLEILGIDEDELELMRSKLEPLRGAIGSFYSSLA